MIVVSDCSLDHSDPVVSTGNDLPPLVRWRTGWHKQHLIKPELCPAVFGDDEVAEMDWIERSAEDADSSHVHDTHSSSIGPKRTTSPGRTPTFSKASVTPSFLS